MHRSSYHVFWAGCYQHIDGAENEIRGAKIAGRWPNRGEASRCDSTIRSCCTAISQPSGCQLSTMEATNTHFIFMAFLAWCGSHHHTLAAVRQPGSMFCGVLSAVCRGPEKKGCTMGKWLRVLGKDTRCQQRIVLQKP